ncbi:hypothetical protein [Desulfosporosinus sp. BICA1-9]
MDYQLCETAPQKSMDHDFAQRDFVSVEQEFMTAFNDLSIP